MFIVSCQIFYAKCYICVNTSGVCSSSTVSDCGLIIAYNTNANKSVNTLISLCIIVLANNKYSFVF